MLQEMVSRPHLSLAGSTSGGRRQHGSDVPARGVLGALSSFELAERLVQVWIRSDQHLRTLSDLNDKLGLVRAYLASPAPNRALGGAYLERLRGKRARCLALLREERRTAMALMAESDARTAGGRRRARGA